MKKWALLAIALQTIVVPLARADQLREDHPIIGTWRIDIPALSCTEVYRVRGDGTMLVTSAEEVAESTFVISDEPTDSGFYKWVDTITKDNGKKDCTGSITQVGEKSTTYLIFDRNEDRFLMCQSEDIATCIGPFVRVRDQYI